MSTFYKCDRCRKEIEEREVIYLSINPEPTKNLDLCPRCYGDLRAFLSEKGNIHLFKRKLYEQT